MLDRYWESAGPSINRTIHDAHATKPTAEGERAYHMFQQEVERAAARHELRESLESLRLIHGSMGHCYYNDADEREKLERCKRLTSRIGELITGLGLDHA